MTFFDEIQHNLNQEIPFIIFKNPEVSDIYYAKEEVGNQYFTLSSFDKNTQLQFSFIAKKNVTIEILGKSFEKLKIKAQLADNESTTKYFHVQLVKKAIQKIKEKEFEKVVLSRQIVIHQTINLLETFKNLIRLNTNTYIYIWFHPQSGIWIGATPEILVKIIGKELKTMSLAGTKTLKNKWTEKEFEEQQLVTKYIQNQLEPFSESIDTEAIKTVQAHEFQHLRTQIKALLKTTDYTRIINALHPTPAVCGIPYLKSFSYIIDNETYNREFYTGYIGEQSKAEVSLYVNLRCAKVTNNQVVIYVGGGINHLSNPEKEWEETELKSRVILNALVN